MVIENLKRFPRAYHPVNQQLNVCVAEKTEDPNYQSREVPRIHRVRGFFDLPRVGSVDCELGSNSRFHEFILDG